VSAFRNHSETIEMAESPKTKKLMVEINRLRSRLSEVEDSLGAIQRGEVDALLVSGPDGEQIYTLQGAEHPYRVMVEAINEGAATLLPDGTILYSNRQFATMLNVPLDKLIGKTFQDFFPFELRPAILELLAQARAGAVRKEVELPRNGRSVLPAQLSICAFNDSSVEALCVVATDLSQLKRVELERVLAERALSEEEERNRLILSNIKDYAIFLVDASGRVASWDQGAERLHGFSKSEVMGRHVSCFYGPAEVKLRRPEMELKTAAAENRSESEGWRLRQDGSRFWANVIFTSLRDHEGAPQAYICVTRDVTDRKRAEEDLRRFSARLMNSQDQERRRLARELHDSEGQNLSVLLMSLAKLKRTTPASDQATQAVLSECTDVANECLRGIRTLSYLLHPPLLDEFGLISALQWYVDGFSERSGIAVTLDLPLSLNRLSEEVETSLFRLVQEGLTNIHRHSGSQTAKISLAAQNGSLRLCIEDHGKGMDLTKLFGHDGASTAGVGIAGMKERVRELGGTFQIESSPQKTVVSVSLPIASRATSAQTA
jgi:PAS domain S-box-containing protein